MANPLRCLACGEPQRDRDGNPLPIPPSHWHGYIPDFCDDCQHRQAVQYARDRIRKARADLRRLNASPLAGDSDTRKETT